jgi:hypothetical protein
VVTGFDSRSTTLTSRPRLQPRQKAEGKRQKLACYEPGAR